MNAAEVGILGGRGFVGSAFVRACTQRGQEPVVIDRQNYRDFVGTPFALFINANGNSRKYLAEREPLREFDESVRSVRGSLVDFPANAYIHISSCDVYPDCSSPATTVESTCPEPARQSAYGFHKHLAEQCVRHGSRRHLIVRAGGFVGPGLKKNAVFDILRGHDLWIDPDSELQFMHSDRFAALVLDLAAQGAWDDTFNLCGEGVISMREVARLAGRPPNARPGCPRIRYEVSLAKVSDLITVPSTRDAVTEFIREAARRP